MMLGTRTGWAWAATAMWLSSVVARQQEMHQELPHHKLSRPFIYGGVDIKDWSYGGNTIVTSEQIRLTADRQSQSGYVFNDIGMRRKDWQVEFEYKVHGQGSRVFGDGFAFWYLSDKQYRKMQHTKSFLGDTFGGPTTFDGLLVSFDTYRNGNYAHQFPWISAMHGDGTKTFDHDNDGKEHELDGCVHRFRNPEESELIKIIYTKGTLGIYTASGRFAKWEECLLITDVWFPQSGHFGFTAHTGDVADNHDIIKFNAYPVDLNALPDRQRESISEASHGSTGEDNVKFAERRTRNTNTDKIPTLETTVNPEKLKEIHKSRHEHKFKPNRKPSRKEDTPTVSGILWMFAKICMGITLVILIIVGAYFGYEHMKKKQAQRRFT